MFFSFSVKFPHSFNAIFVSNAAEIGTPVDIVDRKSNIRSNRQKWRLFIYCQLFIVFPSL